MAKLLPDLVLVIHALFVAFVVLGLLAILLYRHRSWTRNRWFRIAHLLAIAIVIAESWLNLVCPLTEWESRLREAAGGPGYTDPFIRHWLHQLLFYDAEPWVFTLTYTVFGILVAMTWWFVPPGRRR